MPNTHHENHQLLLLPLVHDAIATHAQAASALAALRLIRSEQRIAHLGPIQNRISGIPQHSDSRA